MRDIDSAITYLYEHFILRDVLSFVTPGAIVVLTAFFLLLPGTLQGRVETLFTYSRDMHWLLYILLFGVFYIAGFAMQCLGEMFGFVRFSPYLEKSWCKRWNMFLCSWDKNYEKPCESNMWWWRAHKEWTKFFKAVMDDTGYNERLRQGRERLVILKQMCANAFLAIFMSAIVTAIGLWSPLASSIFLGVLLLASLFWGHRVHTLMQYTRERIATIDQGNAPPETSGGGVK